MKIIHNAVIGCQHAGGCYCLEDIDQQSMMRYPVGNSLKVFRRKCAEHEDEYVMQDDVVQAVIKSILKEWAGTVKRPNIAGIKIENHIDCK